MSEPVVTIRNWEQHGCAWKAAASYALAQTRKKWTEEGNRGEPEPAFLAEWLGYYLAQQWDYSMPSGGLYSPMVTE